MSHHRSPVALVRLLAACAVLGCADDTNAPPPPDDDGGGGVRIASIDLASALTVIEVGRTERVTASVKRADGIALTQSTLTWASSNPSVATVVSTGGQSASVHAVGAGSTTISAAAAGVAGTRAFVVLPAPDTTPPPPPPPPVARPFQAFVWTPGEGIVAVGHLPGVTESFGAAINERGDVAGHMSIAGSYHAFFWSRQGGMIDLGMLPGSVLSRASAINDLGQVVGVNVMASGERRAFRWAAATGMSDLGVIPGGTSSVALGVDAGGQTVGASTTENHDRPVRWAPSGVVERLNPLPGDFSGWATAVNDAGEIVGFSGKGAFVFGFARAVLWTADGAAVPITSCPETSSCSAIARAISPNGRVVGDSAGRPFVWTRAGGLTYLDMSLLFGQEESAEATGVNDRGDVVGTSVTYFGSSAFIWTAAGGIRELPALPGKWSVSAAGINSRGQVVGTSR